MANTLRFKRGLVSGIPTAALGEPLFTTDTFDLYIGNGTGNTRFQKYIASGTTSQLLRGDGSLYTFPLAISSPSAGQVLKYNGTSWVNDSDAGITGSGTTNYLPKFTGATTLGNSLMYEQNGQIGLATSGQLAFYVSGGYSFAVNGVNIPYFGLASGIETGGSGNASMFISGYDNLKFYTNNLFRARITSGGNFIINNASTDNGLRFQVTGDGYFSGSVGIGTSSLTGISLRVIKNITGATSAYGVLQDGQVQSDVTSQAFGFQNTSSTQATAFTLSNYFHYIARQGTFGAGSTVTNQYGFQANSTLIGATNNYGFYGDIASGTGRWNLYMNGTAANYLAGNLGIGSAITTFKLSTFNAGSYTIGLLNSSIGTVGEHVGITYGFGASTYNKGAMYFISRDANGRGDFHFALNNAASAANVSTSDARMILTYEGNLGLGVTPSAWFSSSKAMQFNAGSIYTFSTDRFFVGQNTYIDATGVDNYYANGFASRYQQYQGQHIWQTAPSGTANTSLTWSTRMTLDASGNLGLGVTPSAWGSGRTALEIGNRTVLYNFNGPYLGNNFYVNSSLSAIYKVNGPASIFTIESDGLFRWYNAPSGTAGNAITFTQAMTLDASGNLLVGQTSNPYTQANRTVIGLNGTTDSLISMSIGGTAAAYLFASSTSLDINASSRPLTFSTTGAEKARIFNNGNFAIGTTTDAGFKLDVNGTMRVSGASTFSSSISAAGQITGPSGVSEGKFNFLGYNGAYGGITSNTGYSNFYNAVYLYSNFNLARNGQGNTAVPSYILELGGSTPNDDSFAILRSPAGSFTFSNLFKVSGTGAATFSSSVTVASNLTVDTNTLFVDATNNRVGIGTVSPNAKFDVFGTGLQLGTTPYYYNTRIINNNNSGLLFGGDNSLSVGFIAGINEIAFVTYGGAGWTEKVRLSGDGNLGIANLTPSYKLDVTGEARVSNAISIGTTPDTNKPFKILKNINGTVGINFENTSTGSSAFSAIQMGTDVSGGTKFTNIVYSSSGVAQSGVYYPDGTSIINIGTGGLNFYSQGAPIRMFNGGGNGVLKWEMVNDSFINHYTGTAPTTSATDGYRQYSADVTAGNAAPHFRTENGAVIKLYQETTGVGNAIFSQGGGNSVLDDSTFDGYTLRQIVKALRNQGILA